VLALLAAGITWAILGTGNHHAGTKPRASTPPRLIAALPENPNTCAIVRSTLSGLINHLENTYTAKQLAELGPTTVTNQHQYCAWCPCDEPKSSGVIATSTVYSSPGAAETALQKAANSYALGQHTPNAPVSNIGDSSYIFPAGTDGIPMNELASAVAVATRVDNVLVVVDVSGSQYIRPLAQTVNPTADRGPHGPTWPNAQLRSEVLAVDKAILAHMPAAE
jgi:hypothetical protein